LAAVTTTNPAFRNVVETSFRAGPRSSPTTTAVLSESSLGILLRVTDSASHCRTRLSYFWASKPHLRDGAVHLMSHADFIERNGVFDVNTKAHYGCGAAVPVIAGIGHVLVVDRKRDAAPNVSTSPCRSSARHRPE
jgi:hypothetical protein